MKKGFSLVELSIVLVILGLLTGGILGGQALIRAAELRSVTSEYTRWVTATQTFRDKYFAVPGDMTNATRFWGDNATLCADAGTTDGAPGTCNGNGNGLLGQASGTGTTGEMFQYWNQLALAGLIEGTYTGFSVSSTVGSRIGENSPRSKISSTGWTAIMRTSPNTMFFNSIINVNTLQVGQEAGGSLYDPFLKPEEAWNIDSKLDDGKANQGKVRAIWWDECTTAVDNLDASAEYVLSDTAKRCALVYPSAF